MDSIPAVIASLIFTSLLWIILKLLFKDNYRSAILVTCGLILFFSYGHVQALIQDWQITRNMFADARRLLIIWALIYVLAVWLVLSKLKDAREFNILLNWVAVAALAFPIYTLVSFFIQPELSENQIVEINLGEDQDTVVNPPDIYYIILDAYGRADVLADIYGFENDETLDYLTERDFYIADQSYANYPQTSLSLASSLNMDYVNYLTEIMGINSRDRYPLYNLIVDNSVRRYLEQFGYQTVSFRSGSWFSEIRDADHYKYPEAENSVSSGRMQVEMFGIPLTLHMFDILLLETTVLEPLLFSNIVYLESTEDAFEAHRKRTLFAFENLAEFADKPGSYFVFAHIMAPHPPFIFEADGSNRIMNRSYNLNDGPGYIGLYGTREEYISRYRNQLIFVNSQLRTAIDEIFSKSETPPVIIIQSDHGPGAYLRWIPELANLQERMAILNAYYLPEGDGGQLYPGISPINSFRVVFNQYFGADLEMLDDEYYFSDFYSPYNLIDITTELVIRVE
ncbi:MAG: hypothetical protein FVQ83_00275 [Chloroflexi bacterium]|nr:hypothetical protein [Chloroflexota bacterium]